MTGWAKEKETGTAQLEDVDEDSFIRLCQFAYTGDFAVPKPLVEVTEKSEQAHVVIPEIPASFGFGYQAPPTEWGGFGVPPQSTNAFGSKPFGSGAFGSSQKSKLRSGAEATRKLAFRTKTFCTEFPSVALARSCEVKPTSATNSYMEVLHSYASLYALADRYMIESLKSLTLHKLHKTLVDFPLSETRVNDILELAHYTYSGSSTHDYGGDQLRSLVAEYVVCEIAIIGKTERFLTMLEEGGPFVRDFWRLYREDHQF
jgi:hypothetical protein